MARGRCSVTIDGTKFKVMDAEFRMETKSDHAGMPVMATFETSIFFTVDLNDPSNFPFGNTKKIFDLANVVVRDKIKECKVEFWDGDDEKNVTVSYKGKAWVKSFRTTNIPQPNGERSDNHLLLVELRPVVNKENYQEIQCGN